MPSLGLVVGELVVVTLEVFDMASRLNRLLITSLECGSQSLACEMRCHRRLLDGKCQVFIDIGKAYMDL